MTGFARDCLYGLRQIRKNPGYAMAAIFVLALGIGATTGMLAIVQSVLVRPLNYRDANRIVLLGVAGDPNRASDFSYRDFEEMRHALNQFSHIAAYSSMPVPVETSDGAQMIVAPAVSADFFDVLGVAPEFGRLFREGDDGAGSAVISHSFWQHSMHARADVLGSKVRVNGDAFTVIGVMPAGFQFPVQTETLWTTLQIGPEQKTKQGFDTFSVIARLKEGVSIEQARAAGDEFWKHKQNSGSSNHFWVTGYQHIVTGDEKPALVAMLAACLLLLAIAVVNTANLQIARAIPRQGEIAVRSALGANRIQLFEQLVLENLALAFSGALPGWLLARAFVGAAHALFADYPRFDEIRLDPRIFLLCLGLTMGCGLVAALAPAWHLLRGRYEGLRQQGSNRGSRPQRLTGLLAAAQVAFTCVLLITAGLFLRTLRSLENVPLGFVPHQVTSFLLWPEGGVADTTKVAGYERVLTRLEHLGEVRAAGMATTLPVSNFQLSISGGFSIPGHLSPGQKRQPQVRMVAVSPGYFAALQIPLLEGRMLSLDDAREAQLVGLVNREFVNRYLRGQNPIGQEIIVDPDAHFPQPITIIGVVGDVIQGNNIGTPIQPEIAVPFAQLPPSAELTHFLVGITASFVVRSAGNAGNLGSEIRAIVANEAPGLAIDTLIPLERAVQNTLATQRRAVQITSCLGWIALALSVTGLYGVLAFLVGQRVREIGIRIALGAARRDVCALVLHQGLTIVTAGLLTGCLAARFAGRWIRAFLFATTANDFSTYLAAAGIVVFASAIAIFLPARRATRIDPMIALRYE